MRFLLFTLLASVALAASASAWPWGRDDDLDFSSVEAMQESIESVTNDMTPADKEAFGRALLAILMENNPVTGAAEPGLPQLMAMGQLGENFYDGMDIWMSQVTVETVKARATKLAALDDARAAAKEAEEAEKQQQLALLSSQQLCLEERIEISNIRVTNGDFSDNLEFDITNNLPFAISGVEFEYVVMQQGRSVPIEKDKSSFSISGGVEPGETRSLAYYYHGPVGEEGQTFVETRMINAFDAVELPLLDTNTTYIGRPDGFSDMQCT